MKIEYLRRRARAGPVGAAPKGRPAASAAKIKVAFAGKYICPLTIMIVGAVRALGTPRSRLFEAVLDAPFVLALKPLFAVERAHWKRLQQALHSVLARPAVLSAWLYGSVARRQDTPDSDIDLAVVLSDFSIEAQLRDELDEVGKRFNVDLSLITLSPTDVAQRPAEDPWWEGLERDAQVLKGLSPAEQRLTRQSAA